MGGRPKDDSSLTEKTCNPALKGFMKAGRSALALSTASMHTLKRPAGLRPSPHLEYKAAVKVLDGQHALHAVQVGRLDLDHRPQPVVDLRHSVVEHSLARTAWGRAQCC